MEYTVKESVEIIMELISAIGVLTLLSISMYSEYIVTILERLC